MSREPTVMPSLLSYRMGPSLARPGMYLLGGPAQNDPPGMGRTKNQGKQMKPAKLALITTLLAFSLAMASTAADAGAPAQQPAAEGKDQSSPADQTTDDDALKYEEAYNKGDAKTLGGFFSDDVDYIDQDGAEVKGRDAMERLLADNFQQNPGAKLAITTEEIKQLTPDVKVSRGSGAKTAASRTVRRVGDPPVKCRIRLSRLMKWTVCWRRSMAPQFRCPISADDRDYS